MDISTLYTTYLLHPVISTDTRKITPGCVFFALKGEHFDGNAFAGEALRLGAVYAVVSDPALTATGMIQVENTLTALQELGRHHRRQLDIPVVAITGSNGKTTTKELITAILSKKYKVHATSGNLNNHIGVPLTLLSTPAGTEIIICEMGANHIGEIAFLCTIAQPTHGLITNIGQAHLEGFGSIEGVKIGKGELFAYLREKEGIAFVNRDDPRLRELSEVLLHKITFGFEPEHNPQIQFSYTPTSAGYSLTSGQGDVRIESTLIGQYNASNMLAAYVIGEYFDVDEADIRESLSSFIPEGNRSELIHWKGCIIVKDAYNANPTSMALALQAFSDRYPEGWVVLGDMKEMGDQTANVHSAMIQRALILSFQRIFLVGEAFNQAAEWVGSDDPRLMRSASIEQLKKDWDWQACQGRAILLKGSRSMHLEHLLAEEV